MTDRADPTLDDIRTYWSDAAGVDRDADGMRPTARDPWLQEAVETAIEQRLLPGVSLLDIGCGDGLSTLRFAGLAGRVTGIDYIAQFVERARGYARARGAANVTFDQGDVLDLGPLVARHGQHDVAVSIRCLINLANWDNQRRGLAEIAATVRPGGLLLISEGWQEGMDGLNLRRTRAGLAPIQVVRYNVLMGRQAFETEARRHFEILDYVSLGFYLYMSRVFQPLLVAPESPRHDHPVNRVAALAQAQMSDKGSFDDCDYAGVYVLRRR